MDDLPLGIFFLLKSLALFCCFRIDLVNIAFRFPITQECYAKESSVQIFVCRNERKETGKKIIPQEKKNCNFPWTSAAKQLHPYTPSI